jgi:pimeloyl-ACP methyl ester carboxylesterase
VEVADRRLNVVDLGREGDRPVVIHHGSPGGTVPHPDWVEDATARGLRLIAYHRPGYGASTRHPGRTVADAAVDVVAIADALGLDRFLTWGTSGGGPHALACAALRPDRVIAAATLASVGPYGVDGLDYLAGMGEGNIAEFGLALSDGAEGLAPALAADAREMLAGTAADLVTSFAPHLTEADAGVLRGGYAETMLAQIRDGCADGVDGWIDDDLAFIAPWGFDVADIRVPVLVLQGRQDAMVPYAHGEWLAARIPTAEPRLSETDGHLSLVTQRIGEVHAWLSERWG